MDPIPTLTFGQQLKKLHTQTRLKSKDLAKLVDINSTMYSKLLNDKRFGNIYTITKIAEVFGLSYHQLMEGVTHVCHRGEMISLIDSGNDHDSTTLSKGEVEKYIDDMKSMLQRMEAVYKTLGEMTWY